MKQYSKKKQRKKEKDVHELNKGLATYTWQVYACILYAIKA
jgi:hypothetical protein